MKLITFHFIYYFFHVAGTVYPDSHLFHTIALRGHHALRALLKSATCAANFVATETVLLPLNGDLNRFDFWAIPCMIPLLQTLKKLLPSKFSSGEYGNDSAKNHRAARQHSAIMLKNSSEGSPPLFSSLWRSKAA